MTEATDGPRVITIAGANWVQLLAAALTGLRDGDTLIVSTAAQKELAERAIARSRRGLQVTIQVDSGDEA